MTNSRCYWWFRGCSFVLLGTLVLVSCGGQQDQASSTTEAETAEAVPESSLKLYVFDCGRLRFDTVTNFGINDDETEVRELIVPCYVVDHPDGRLLWEGGLPSSIKQTAQQECEAKGGTWTGTACDLRGTQSRRTVASGRRPSIINQNNPTTGQGDEGKDDNGWVGNAKLQRTLAEQIAASELEFDLSGLDYMAFSHIHYDHVGVANEISGATWLVQRGDYEAAFADPITVPAVQPELLTNLRDADRLILDGDHDVFGDGRVRLISAPGHTPGHQVLFLDLEWAGPLVLSGDLYHFRISRTDRRVPVFNVDPEMSLQSMDKVEAFVAEQEAMFWIEHDLELFQTLQISPRYYE